MLLYSCAWQGLFMWQLGTKFEHLPYINLVWHDLNWSYIMVFTSTVGIEEPFKLNTICLWSFRLFILCHSHTTHFTPSHPYTPHPHTHTPHNSHPHTHTVLLVHMVLPLLSSQHSQWREEHLRWWFVSPLTNWLIFSMMKILKLCNETFGDSMLVNTTDCLCLGCNNSEWFLYQVHKMLSSVGGCVVYMVCACVSAHLNACACNVQWEVYMYNLNTSCNGGVAYIWSPFQSLMFRQVNL